MADTEIITYHGWGFDAECWQKLQSLFADSIKWKNFDRGYFNDPESPSFSEGSNNKVAVVHSFGLHLCEEDVLQKADLLVIMSGFLHFHPKAAQFRRRSKLVLSEMINQFEQKPEKVLKTFYRNVFHPQKTFDLPNEEMDHSLLLEDLKLLDRSEISLPVLKNTARICIFQGADDAIVPKEKGRGLFNQFGDQAQYFEIKKAGHALPIAHAPRCREILEPMITSNFND
ncbi:MAG: alpha/beta hydrolase [Balneolaceae bacterium]|nr:alpha/beta hydrolase [Balneolaceae bacterium]